MNEQYTPLAYGSTPPRLSITSPEEKAYNTSSIPVNFTSNKQVDWSGCSVDGWANVTVTEGTLLTDLSEGAHNLILYANDTFGNMGASSVVYFSVDTSNPIILIQSPENKAYDTNEVPLNFTIHETITWLAYSLDGKENVTIDKNTTLAGLTDGGHTLTIYATDAVGNTGASETVQFSIEPFPVILVVGVAVTAVIVVLAGYLFWRRRRAAYSWN